MTLLHMSLPQYDRSAYYILDRETHALVVVPMLQWSRFWADIASCRVAETFFSRTRGVQISADEAWAELRTHSVTRLFSVGDSDTIFVSTVFLGIDHNFAFEGPPVLFETMVFGGNAHEYQRRSCTWDEAMSVHAEAVQLVKEGLGIS